MSKLLLYLKLSLFVAVLISLAAAPIFGHSAADRARWEQTARNVTFTRDDWGIAHVVGKTDADAVFGAIYAQAEDDFNRIETNYLNSMGRLAEAEGESAIWSDLRMKIFIDPVELRKQYSASPEWLRKLMDAWADGLNFYLAKHPNVKPRVITHFEPWMALSFTEGSIGGDIETINLDRLRMMYSDSPVDVAAAESDDILKEPSGSNGIAISPKNTVGNKALLLINPHTSFYFRSELQMTSGEGLNAYGASTWGQFFIYQGFNEHCGWMHTSSAADSIDEFRETVEKRPGKDGIDKYFYKFGNEMRPVSQRQIIVPYKSSNSTATRRFMVYRTHHGPVVRKDEQGRWITVALMNTPVKALMQSFGRTKAKNFDEFKQVMELKANSSNNTLYADADGNIAYFHVNYMPRRDPKFDWTRPVDGSDPASDYKGLHALDDLPNLKNPASGWVYNSNNWPWSAAGPSSLKQTDFPRYVDSGIESARGRHAIRVLENKKDFTLDLLTAAAYDSYLPAFEKPIPAVVKAWDEMAADNPLKAKLFDQIAILRAWDLRWSTSSIPTSLAIFWAASGVGKVAEDAKRAGLSVDDYMFTKAAAEQLLQSLAAASDRLTADFGSWKTPWGEINRFQRISGEIVHPFDDARASIPVGFPSGNWGSLASFGARPTRTTKKWYGTSGNSFVAVVEFGKTIRAKAVTAGGESGDPKSKHFNDQATRYATGNLRDVYFYPLQLKGHIEKTYKPGK